jgi:hypothetical protein
MLQMCRLLTRQSEATIATSQTSGRQAASTDRAPNVEEEWSTRNKATNSAHYLYAITAYSKLLDAIQCIMSIFPSANEFKVGDNKTVRFMIFSLQRTQTRMNNSLSTFVFALGVVQIGR